MPRRLIRFSVLTLIAANIVIGEPVYRVGYQNALSSGCNEDGHGPEGCGIHLPAEQQKEGALSVEGHEPIVEAITENDTAVEEGRGKKKKKGYGPLLMGMAGLWKASMLYLMLHAVAALAGKALIVAKVALAIATAVGLKKALEGNGKTSYEIVSHPKHTYSQTHSSSVDYENHGGYEGHRRRKRRIR